ncbi:MAG: glycoside hydrolase family 3 N-terminal domain-containing protein [Pseudomonadota bacterium]
MTSAAILAPTGPRLSASEQAFLRAADPWGYILFARNVENPEQLRRLTGDLRNAVGREAVILIDQEGGRVQRMRAPYWREWYPAADQVAQAGPTNAARSMWLRARLIAAELRAVGIDGNCAPLADVARDTTHPILKNRLYGTSPKAVTGAARAVARGLLAGGVLPVLKHLPGYGLAEVDSHLDLPRVKASRATLSEIDFAAFRPLNDLPMGMTAHIALTEIAGPQAATLSPELIRLIREDIGFDGLLMTDDISMEALPGALGARSAAALAAGCDLVLHCTGVMNEMAEVVAAAGDLDAASQARATRALAARQAPEPLDIDAAEAELGSLLQDKVYAGATTRSG